MLINVSDVKVRKRIRKENGDIHLLMESMREHGLINPIVVTEKYELIAGFRRFTAATKLGWDVIPATVVEASTKLQKLELEMEENIQRLDFNDDELYEGLLKIDRYRNPTGFRYCIMKIKDFFVDFFDKIEARKEESRKKNGRISLFTILGIGIIVGSGFLFHKEFISNALLTILNIIGFGFLIVGILFLIRYIRGLSKK